MRFVIVGGGLAAAKAAEALREQGFDGEITLVAAERHRPYERPPLSKDLLKGNAEQESVFVHPQTWYAEHDVELRLDTAATGLDASAHQLIIGEDRLGYDKLLIATGSRPRRIPGADGVQYLRTLEDSIAVREAISAGSRLAVVGGGWIGLEVAAAAREAGCAVTVIETLNLPLLRVLGPEVAQVFADLHRAHGVELVLDARPTQITADAVQLRNGERIVADTVVVGVGATPNVELAESAGLPVDNGILVDAALRTSDPDVVAAGDVANALHPVLDRRIRVEHWANALNQPAVAAATMRGESASYDELPYFYTDQYDLGMEYVGYVEPDEYDRVVFRGDVEAREFIAFWLAGDRVLAGMNVNVWDVVDPIKQLIGSRRVIDPARLADPSVELSEL